MTCARCEGLAPEQVEQLRVIGGSHNPFGEPYGELWECSCGQRFLYTRDHDNEIGYQADPPSLVPMTPEQVKEFVPRAIAEAQKSLAHFQGQRGIFAESMLVKLDAELARLTSTT